MSCAPRIITRPPGRLQHESFLTAMAAVQICGERMKTTSCFFSLEAISARMPTLLSIRGAKAASKLHYTSGECARSALHTARDIPTAPASCGMNVVAQP